MNSTDDILLEARGIFKQYPGVIALDHIHFRVHRNAVNVLIGENGAGKSTLMSILAGAEIPDAGEILLEGQSVKLRSPRDAAAHGIAIVYQELSIFPNLDLSENIFAGRELARNILIDRPTEDLRTHSALSRLGKPMPATTQAATLSLGRRQIVEVARILAHGARILILDEPTSALSVSEAESLFQVLAELKAAGLTIIYISHRLHELLHLGDYFTVLRSGKVVGEGKRNNVDRAWIVECMSGRAPTASLLPTVTNTPLLTVSNLAVPPQQDSEVALSNIRFTLNQGEIVGIYGLLGSGRTELLEALAGARRSAGEVSLRGRRLQLLSISAAVKQGLVLVPEDRQRDGLIPELSIRENIALGSFHGLVINRKEQQEHTEQLARDLNISVPDLDLPITTLSGGNQQKALLARCLMQSPAVLLLDEPTRGVDASAKIEIYNILQSLAAKGIGILFTSSEIEETLILAAHAIVLCQGRIAADLAHSEITDDALFAAASPRITTSYESPSLEPAL
jgi:erythritol transport system ATP-binding protein